MKTTLYWFSGTGNTLLAARMLADRLGDCELRPIMAELAKDRVALEGERVGILFPLYFLCFPKPVMDFLERMENPSGVPLFAVVTRGMSPMGGVRWPLNKACRLAGTELTGLFYLDMPNNDVTLFKPDPEASVASKLSKLPSEIERVAAAVVAGGRERDAEPLGWVRPFRHGPAYLDRLAGFGKNFRSESNCSGCGICAKVCPVGNIVLSDGKPVWGSGCVLCEGCLNWCPARAIQYGETTRKKGRYTCAGISSAEIATQKGV